MVVAYDDTTEEIAMELKKLGFTVVSSEEAERYDSFIYKIHTAEGLRSMTDKTRTFFYLIFPACGWKKSPRYLSPGWMRPSSVLTF